MRVCATVHRIDVAVRAPQSYLCVAYQRTAILRIAVRTYNVDLPGSYLSRSELSRAHIAEIDTVTAHMPFHNSSDRSRSRSSERRGYDSRPAAREPSAYLGERKDFSIGYWAKIQEAPVLAEKAWDEVLERKECSRQQEELRKQQKQASDKKSSQWSTLVESRKNWLQNVVDGCRRLSTNDNKQNSGSWQRYRPKSRNVG